MKSDDALKKTFAHVDNELAKDWHATAQESMKAGKAAARSGRLVIAIGWG